MERKRYGSLVWPFLLIAFGIIFLLNNLGYLGWDIWLILFRMWPLLLIALGLDVLVGRRSTVGAVFSFVIVLLLFFGGLWFFYNVSPGFGGGIVTERVVQPLEEDISEAVVSIDFGVGVLQLDAQRDGNDLFDGALDLTEEERLDVGYRVDEETAYFEVGTDGPQISSYWFFQPNDQSDFRTWDVSITRDVPIDLNVDAGVGEIVLDLEALDISDLDVDGGVGKLTLYLPETGEFDANLSAGVGEMIIYVQSGTAIRINVDGGIGDVSVSGEFVQDGETYFSDSYEAGADYIDMNIDGGVGAVRVRMVER
jgi:hypothetical protein